jgi:glycerol-3-phosphate dehydrogenase
MATVTHTTAWTRSDHLARLRASDMVDVLVVGGGVTGAGAALDLAVRGLDVALVDQADFAQGTSSRSTKLFHGGVRYLPHFEFNLVSEGLREQKVLARIADFLYEPLEFVIPLYEQYGFADAPKWAASGWKAPLALRAGLTLYDVLGGLGRPGHRHRRLDADAIRRLLPALSPDGLEGGFVYSDAQTDDARLVISVLKTAVRRYGVIAAGQVRVDGVEPLEPGFRVVLTDRASGEPFSVAARTVLSATGAFDPPGLTTGAPTMRVVRSKGTHLLASPEDIPLGGRALVLPETDDGRVLFIVPWLGHSMIGTTDTPYGEDPAHPVASEADTAYLIRHVRQYLDIPEFQPISAFAGLRALRDSGDGSTAKASREHVIEEPVAGYVQVAGGKLTTYRRIAAEAADHIARALGVPTRSGTDAVPLVGAGMDRAALIRRLEAVGYPDSAIEPSIGRYGGEIERLVDLVEADPALSQVLDDGRTTAADVVHAIRHEAATRLSDITLRRTHLAWFTPEHSRSDVERIADLMAGELDWSEAERQTALADHEQELVAEGL